MRKKGLLLLLLCSFLGIAQPEDLFQTWYLYSYEFHFDEPSYYTGEDVPLMIINEDLSFYATDNCWEITGDFGLVYDNQDEQFGLEVLNYDKACVFDGSSGYVLELMLGFDETINCWAYSDMVFMETYFGEGPTFKNEITLDRPENSLSSKVIYPNPSSNYIQILDLNNEIEAITLLDVQGKFIKKIKRSHFKTINVSALKKGIYFLKLQSGKDDTIKKFIKN